MSRNVLVSGVSRGLGLAIAQTALAEGWTVFGVSRSTSPELEALANGCGGRLYFQSLDLSAAESVSHALFDQFIPPGTPLHGVVHNAAVAYDDLVTNLDLDRVRAMYEVNLFAPMVITKYAIRRMLVEQTRGSIVHVSSVSAHTGYKGLAMYASTKGALEAFSLNTAREWGERGIRSNCVAAGFMETDMTTKLSAEQRQSIVRRTGLKQLTTLSSVAATILFLLGDAAAAITGEVIRVDSGVL
jgi:3-oxoacyl-[acyl-carrier protein] reductase